LNPRTTKTAFLVVILLASSAGYMWHLQLYSREERTLRMVEYTEHETLEPIEHDYSSRSKAYADNVTLTLRATDNVTVTFLRFVYDEEGFLDEIPVQTFTTRRLDNHTFTGYDLVGFGLNPTGNSSVDIYVEIIKPRWETHKTHLEEAAPYGYLSSAGLLFVGSCLLLEALWWTYTTRIRSALRGRGRISLTRRRTLRLLSPLLATIILYQIGFWTFGLTFFEKNPASSQSVATWLLVALARTGIALYATSLTLNRPLGQTLTKRNLLLAFFLVGPAHPLTQMTLINLTATTGWMRSLDPFMLTGLLHIIQEALKSWFTAMGLTYATFLIVYFLALDPLIIELPRLTALILVNKRLGPGARSPDEARD
jgi:hypothetical protein